MLNILMYLMPVFPALNGLFFYSRREELMTIFPKYSMGIFKLLASVFGVFAFLGFVVAMKTHFISFVVWIILLLIFTTIVGLLMYTGMKK